MINLKAFRLASLQMLAAAIAQLSHSLAYIVGSWLSSCPACPAGQFSTAARQLSCTPCAPGTFAARERTVTCEACPGGLFAASTGSTECEPCAAGRYAEDPGGQAVGASSCKRCARSESIPLHAVALCA